MMILDGHVHIHCAIGQGDRADLLRRLKSAGVAGAVIISLRPQAVAGSGVSHDYNTQQRLDQLFHWTEADENLYPVYWIDPIESDAIEQVQRAVKHGVLGFKVICHAYYPADKRALKVFAAIAAIGKPILFHSGILWDGVPSADYNRPARFEALLDIKGLRFCLAHLSWPWCDEMIAVYGKFQNACVTRPGLNVEMFIDNTPGTPPIYRREALTRLLTAGYDVENNVIFGSDCNTHDYNVSWVKDWLERDNRIYRSLGIESPIVEKIHGRNLKRFLGLARSKVEKKPLRPGRYD